MSIRAFDIHQQKLIAIILIVKLNCPGNRLISVTIALMVKQLFINKNYTNTYNQIEDVTEANDKGASLKKGVFVSIIS